MTWKLVIRTVLWTIAQAAILFLAAGTLRWPAAWIYLILMFAGGLWIGLWLARYDPALLAERLAPPVQPDQKGWDKAFIPGLLVLVVLWLVVMGLDAGRYPPRTCRHGCRWSGRSRSRRPCISATCRSARTRLRPRW